MVWERERSGVRSVTSKDLRRERGIMQGLLGFLSGLYGLLAAVFYHNSVVRTGYGEVANMQMTVFCAASAVLCGVHFVGAAVLGAVKAQGAVPGQSESTRREEQGILAAKLAKEELMKSKKTFLSELESMESKTEIVPFLSELESMESITEIVQKWDAYHLGDSFPEADMYIGIQARSPHVDLERFKSILVEKLNG